MTPPAVRTGQTDTVSLGAASGGAGWDVPPTPPHPTVPVWLGDVVAVGFVAAAPFVPFPADELRSTGTLVTLLSIAPAAALPLRRRWPIPVLAACLVLYGAVAWGGTLAPGVGIAVCIAMFGVANRSTRRVTLIAGSVAVVAILVLSVAGPVGDLLDPRAIQFALAVALATAAGDAARSQRAYIAAITERAERAERTRETEARRRVSEERLRIARDLHDAVAHQITVISLNAGVASSALDHSPERTRAALGTIRGAARTVLKEIGDLLGMLRTDEPGENTTAPQYGLAHLDVLLERFAAGGLEVHARVDDDLSRIGGAVDLVAYRVIQEALTNAHKHGAEHRASLLLQAAPADLCIVVTNPVDPVEATGGQDPDTALVGPGVGLIGMRERLGSVRGTLRAGRSLGGWKVVATIPLPDESTT